MELKNRQTVKAPLQTVYDALNDPVILKRCIPGCDSIERQSDTEMLATVTLKIGPIKASFDGELEIRDLVPPTRYTLAFKGTGGGVGDATGSARVELVAEEDDTTAIDYEVHADVTGKIAQLGGRLISSTANVLAKKFFKEFGVVMEEVSATPPA